MSLYLKTLVLGTILFLAGYGLSTVSGLKVDSSTLEVFLGLFGAFYAIIIGFIIFIAMDNYNRVRELISAEVNALQDLRDYLVFVDHDETNPKDRNHEVAQDIRRDLRGYVEQVTNREWDIMMGGDRVTADFRDTPEELIQLMRSVNGIYVGNPSDEVALQLMVNTIAQVTTHRTNRLAALWQPAAWRAAPSCAVDFVARHCGVFVAPHSCHTRYAKPRLGEVDPVGDQRLLHHVHLFHRDGPQ